VREKLISTSVICLALAAILIAGHLDVLAIPYLGPEDNTPAANTDDALYGAIVSDPMKYRRDLFAEKWVNKVPVGHTTFGKILINQPRFSISGSGPMLGRRITAETKPADKMLSGRSRKRTIDFFRGFQRLMEDREAYVKGLSFSGNGDGMVANWMVWFVENGYFDGIENDLPKQQQVIRTIINESWQLDSWLAWFQYDSRWIVISPEMSHPLIDALKNPKSVSPLKQLRFAMVLRHELEHSVSGAEYGDTMEQYYRLNWMEEGTADTIARWPGAAAATAKMFGLRYPKRAEKVSYEKLDKHSPGYPGYVETLRILLTLGGIDVNDPDQLDEAEKILQSGPIETLDRRLAKAIVANHGMKSTTVNAYVKEIRQLYGSPRQAKAFQKHVLKAA
jgi:hypothetical protein